ncbi:hypothetical protein LJK88_32400 [Paenibacillus sp. P26]|nr:hypothetical protein LJK88_32400 [Paenibacillus sp. P26]UUZ94115.1 hypothetical protein LJK87_05685 [Paenibacillus sp. P25]
MSIFRNHKLKISLILVLVLSVLLSIYSILNAPASSTAGMGGRLHQGFGTQQGSEGQQGFGGRNFEGQGRPPRR